MKIPRNSPCPCGSNKKYKHCCAKAASVSSAPSPGKTEFEPGSYQTPYGFLPAIMCKCENSEDYCLVKSDASVEEEESAVRMAIDHLNTAFEIKERTGNIAELALSLKSSGYDKLEDFQYADGKTECND